MKRRSKCHDDMTVKMAWSVSGSLFISALARLCQSVLANAGYRLTKRNTGCLCSQSSVLTAGFVASEECTFWFVK